MKIPSFSASTVVTMLQKVAPVFLGPRIEVVTTAPRCKEDVAVFYTIAGSMHGNALKGTWLRLQLINSGRMKATGCLVYVTKIERNGIQLDKESSPLEWTDQDRDFSPKVLLPGEISRRHVNLCGCDELNRALHVASQKALKGYHSFDESGLYTFHITVSVDQMMCSRKLRLNVLYDNNRWQVVHFI